MNSEDPGDVRHVQLLQMQEALFNLRDGLMNLSLSLRELSFASDLEGQRQANDHTEELLQRLRGTCP